MEEEKKLLKTLKRVPDLEFYVLCPNGKRIRAEKMCEEFESNPESGYAYRTFDNRLVIVVEAVFPEEKIYNGSLSVMVDYSPEELYWRQAFYLSTGESSRMSYTWLPFSGIVIDANVNRMALRKNIIGSTWFSKMEYVSGLDFTTYEYKINMPPVTREENQKLEFLDYIYGRLYLPETNFLQSTYRNPFDRWGCPSFVLASHALGGNIFERGGSGPYSLGEYLFNRSEVDSLFGQIIKRVNTQSPLQRCFRRMKVEEPPSNVVTINKYIDKHKALPIMNAFRDIGVFPPGLSFIQMPFPEVGYSIPIKDYYHMLLEVVHYHWKMYKLGKFTEEQIREKFSNPQALLNEYLTLERRSKFAFPKNTPGQYKLWQARIPQKNREFYGGTRKRLSKRKTKGKSRKH